MAARAPIAMFHATHSPELLLAVEETIRSGQLASGPKVAEFQDRFGELIGRPHVVGTSDMTAALLLALRLAGVGADSEVLTLAFSCMSSNSPIALLGARAVWVDIDPATASMSVDDFRRALNPRVKAVTLYHVAGYPGPAEEIAAICRERGIVLIEDCNNALGATRHGRPVGQSGDYAVHSFYPNRQINAIEGGALACPDAQTAARAARLRRFGIDATTFRDSSGEINPQSDIPEIGWSASLNHVSAAAALTQLPHVHRRVEDTRRIAARLEAGLRGLARLRPIAPLGGAQPSYWGFLALADRRDELLAGLKRRNVQATCLHYRNDGYSGFRTDRRPSPGLDLFMDQVIALPCGWWLTAQQVDELIEAVHSECAG